jgi:hypothetical protein
MWPADEEPRRIRRTPYDPEIGHLKGSGLLSLRSTPGSYREGVEVKEGIESDERRIALG